MKARSSFFSHPVAGLFCASNPSMVPVLGLLAAGLMATSLPAQGNELQCKAVIPGAFERGTQTTTGALAEAASSAKRSGKPLLVLLVPKDPKQRAARGRALGAFLSNASHETLLDLALFELVCATRADVEAEYGPGKPAKDGKPAKPGSSAVFMTVDLHRAEASGRRPQIIAASFPSPEEVRKLGADAVARALYSRDLLAAALRQGIGTNRSTLLAIADSVRAKLSIKESESLDQFIADPSQALDTALLLKASALVRMAAAAPRTPNADERLLAKLSEAAKAQMNEAIAGSTWGRLDHCPPCGMGHVPAQAVKFLSFFADDEPAQAKRPVVPGR